MTLRIENGIIPEELRELILSGRCVAFIGSGPSSLIYGSWHNLIANLCAHCGINEIDKTSPEKLLSAAQRAKSNNTQGYLDFLSEHFGKNTHFSRYYDVLLGLPFASYLTTNFDPLLALQARSHKNQCIMPVDAYPSLDRKKMGKRSIHYLHGFIDKNATPQDIDIVLSEDEFAEAYKDCGNVTTFLIPALVEDPIFFIGCSLEEPAMQEIFEICNQQQQRRIRKTNRAGVPQSEPPPRFIALPKSKEKDEEHYRKLGIDPVWYKDTDGKHYALYKALETLVKLPSYKPRHGWEGNYNAP